VSDEEEESRVASPPPATASAAPVALAEALCACAVEAATPGVTLSGPAAWAGTYAVCADPRPG
jgi:hypothetical protein